MAIDRTFESALMKALRGLEVKQRDLRYARIQSLSESDLEQEVKIPTDERIWALADALRRGWTKQRVRELSRVEDGNTKYRSCTHLELHPGLVDTLENILYLFLLVLVVKKFSEVRLVPEFFELLQFFFNSPE